ncbi:unnamed protein product [Ixodes persulcatus]
MQKDKKKKKGHIVYTNWWTSNERPINSFHKWDLSNWYLQNAHTSRHTKRIVYKQNRIKAREGQYHRRKKQTSAMQSHKRTTFTRRTRSWEGLQMKSISQLVRWALQGLCGLKETKCRVIFISCPSDNPPLRSWTLPTSVMWRFSFFLSYRLLFASWLLLRLRQMLGGRSRSG